MPRPLNEPEPDPFNPRAYLDKDTTDDELDGPLPTYPHGPITMAQIQRRLRSKKPLPELPPLTDH